MTESTPASERVREAYDALPGEEVRVTNHNYMQHLSEALPYADLMIDISITTPDGRRFTVSESIEYELDEDKQPLNFDYDDCQNMLETAAAAMRSRLEILPK